MPRRLVVAGIIVTAVALAMLAYLDPVIRILIFGPSGGGQFVRNGTFPGNSSAPNLAGARGTNSVASVATIVVFVVAVIGLLLTVAGSFATGRGIPTAAGPSPAAAKTAQRSQLASSHDYGFRENRY